MGLFALRDGLTTVVQAALVGSILANTVLVLGTAFVAGGLRHGVQHFDPEEPRLNASLLLLVVAALVIPTLANDLHTPAAAHISALSDACAIALLVVYAASVPFYLRSQSPPATARTRRSGRGRDVTRLAPPALRHRARRSPAWAPPWRPTGSSNPSKSATKQLGLSETFTGLVIVAIAANAVEHGVGIRFAVESQAGLRHQHHPQQSSAGGPAADPGPGAVEPGGGARPSSTWSSRRCWSPPWRCRRSWWR